jgi:hypothetical protein
MGNMRVEALLSNYTIYGTVWTSNAEGKEFLQEGLDKFGAVTESVKPIKKQVQTVQTLRVRW